MTFAATVEATGTVTAAETTDSDVSGYHADPQPTPVQVVAAATGTAPTGAGTPSTGAGTPATVADSTLARTGANTGSLVLTGLGLLLVGYSVIPGSDERRRRTAPVHIRIRR